MTWTYECLGDEYAIILTQGRESRTVYTSFQLNDVLFMLDAFEVYELMKGGLPVELLTPKKIEKTKTRKRVAKTG